MVIDSPRHTDPLTLYFFFNIIDISINISDEPIIVFEAIAPAFAASSLK